MIPPLIPRALLAAALAWAYYAPAQLTTNPPEPFEVRTNFALTRAGERHVLVDADTGVLQWPTNFWSANSNSLAAFMGEVAGDVSASGNNAFTGSNWFAGPLVAPADGLTGTLPLSTIPDLPALRLGGTNVIWFPPHLLRNNDDTTLGTSPYQYGAYLGRTSLAGLWSGATMHAAIYHTNVTFGSARGLICPAIFLPSPASNFRVTGYWAATNAVTFRPMARVDALATNDAAIYAVSGSTDWSYASTTTNIQTHSVVLTLATPSSGPIAVSYGVAGNAGGSGSLAHPLWLFAIRLEWW